MDRKISKRQRTSWTYENKNRKPKYINSSTLAVQNPAKYGAQVSSAGNSFNRQLSKVNLLPIFEKWLIFFEAFLLNGLVYSQIWETEKSHSIGEKHIRHTEHI